MGKGIVQNVTKWINYDNLYANEGDTNILLSFKQSSGMLSLLSSGTNSIPEFCFYIS